MTPLDFRTAFPAFKDEPEPKVLRHIADAAPEFDVERWGGRYQRGLGNYVAHMIVLENAAGRAGVDGAPTSDDVLIKQVGSVSVTRSDALIQASARDPFMRTTYGREYKRLRRLVGFGAVSA